MIINDFSALNKQNRKEKIKRIINDKAHDLPLDIVDQVIDCLDLNNQYTITSTIKQNLLIKNAFEEENTTEDFSYSVKIRPLYGNLVPGKMFPDGQIVEPEFDEGIIIFEKETKVDAVYQNSLQYQLFIYLPIHKETGE